MERTDCSQYTTFIYTLSVDVNLSGDRSSIVRVPIVVRRVCLHDAPDGETAFFLCTLIYFPTPAPLLKRKSASCEGTMKAIDSNLQPATLAKYSAHMFVCDLSLLCLARGTYLHLLQIPLQDQHRTIEHSPSCPTLLRLP